MTFRLVHILGLAIAAGMAASAPVRATEAFERVVIDAGHGGVDPGSHAFGLVEKELTLDLARRLEGILVGEGVEAQLTRRADRYVALEKRAELANAEPDTVFVSLHFNAHRDRSISGTETFYWPGSSAGRELASYVQSELGGRLVTRNRGCKPNRLKVLEGTDCTAILVECGFLSNRWESQRCGAAWFRQIVAEEIAQGLLRYRDG